MNKLVLMLIEAAKQLGLRDIDINNSLELLNNREYGLAFDTIITQLYEYEIEIDSEFYELIIKSAQQMKLSENEYLFMKELVRAEDKVPKPVKDRLSEILNTLKLNG